jgi:RNA polymerase sigma-70 factor (ECF subfamily)
MIFALAYRMTGSMADAEDLTQESFIAAFHRFDLFRGESKFSSWLYRIAVNRCINWRQSVTRRERAYEGWGREREVASISEPHVDAVSAQVQQALLKLDEKQRAAIVLTTYDGMNHAEAASVLGCSETTVSWRIFAARRKLKNWLEPLAKGGAREKF